MIQVYECEYCGEIFKNRDDCFKHEIENHEGIERYYKAIYNILNELNGKYDMSKNIDGQNISVDMNSCVCDGYEYTENYISFYLDDCLINVSGSEYIIMHDLKNQMEQCFLDNLKNVEGTLRYEGWCGGHGEDDFIINGTYLKDFLKNKDGKHIKIEIFD